MFKAAAKIDTGEIVSAPDSAQMDTEEAENLK
jgi:hypothetical protein